MKETTRKVGEKDPNQIITCSTCSHGMGVPNGNPIWTCDCMQSLEQDGMTNELVRCGTREGKEMFVYFTLLLNDLLTNAKEGEVKQRTTILYQFTFHSRQFFLSLARD